MFLKHVWNLFTWPERTFTCGSFFEILNCLGEIGLEKNSRNFYKCRGMSRFGEKKLNANNKAPRFARRLKNDIPFLYSFLGDADCGYRRDIYWSAIDPDLRTLKF